MREDYLHYLFASKSLGNTFTTTTGLTLKIQNFGALNPNSGPDFLNAQIQLNDHTWAGSIEFHVKSSDWFLHGHQADESYNNVIAHFVYEHDRDVEIAGVKLPTVELRNRIDLNHFNKYYSVANSRNPIPCAANIGGVDAFVVFQQKQRVLFSRLIRKSDIILQDLKQLNGDVEKTFYLSLARCFGGKVNGHAFEYLIAKTDLQMFQKARDYESTIPAILFGMSGLLPKRHKESYVQDLISEFEFQKHRLNLHPMSGLEFRYSKMFPSGFPTIRLAQFCEILRNGLPVGSLISGELSFEEIRKCFVIDLADFWQTHYRFENLTKKKTTTLSPDFIELIFINAIIPFLFAMGIKNDNDKLKESCFEYLQQIKAETNGIITLWHDIGVEVKTAFDSQALIEQKNEFCSKKKCLFCTVGIQLLRA
ncbi:MAG: DUF2851 family protein [Crocinitomicaceae bacterium]|nr:DUF2851 family protein [Crocinitomicaceae bacterium]